MTFQSKLLVVVVATAFAFSGGRAISGPDKYTVKVPGGLAFSDFRGYEDWPKERDSSRSADGAGRAGQRRFHGEGQ